MAKVEDITVEIRAIDNASPMLRRLRFGFWLYSHPTLVMVSATILIGLLALTTGLLIGERL